MRVEKKIGNDTNNNVNNIAHAKKNVFSLLAKVIVTTFKVNANESTSK